MQVKGELIVKGKLVTEAEIIGKVTPVTGTYTILVTDETISCNSGTPFTVTLPLATVGQFFRIKNIGTAKVTVDANGTDLIDGSLTVSLRQWDCLDLQCYVANNWAIV